VIPIGTDVRLRRRPVANWILIACNVAAFIATSRGEDALPNQWLPPLNGALPALHEYLTYQFRHGDAAHLLGNMIFLWIFGGPVCDRMGAIPYVLFYLAGGVVAGITYATGNTAALVGASGAIAAVTTAFLVLFPRVHVTLLLPPFFPFTVPAMLLIVFKIILWDNILAPRVGGGVYSPVAYSAHLGGYGFGLGVTMLMLLTRSLPRNQFDLLAVSKRFFRRTGITTELPLPGAGPRPVEAIELDSRPLPLPPAFQLREDVLSRLADRDWDEALRLYDELDAQAAAEPLPRDPQREIGNLLARAKRYSEAAKAYERFLDAYGTAADAAEVRLWVGLICSRHLGQAQRARGHLTEALHGLSRPDQIQLATEELRLLENR
jgi:membrane associated rhomboid family serine protease